jgi:hypothetical protein
VRALLKYLLTAQAIAVTGLAALECPSAQADAVAYLVNVTVRPGYNFASANDALA